MGHKKCFYREIWLIIPKLSLLPLTWSTVNALKIKPVLIPSVCRHGIMNCEDKVLEFALSNMIMHIMKVSS